MHLLRSLLILLVAAPLAAQARISRDAGVRATPDGNVIATVQEGSSWQTGAARGGFTQITLEGWIAASRFAGRRDSFPESIGGTGTLRIRAEPSLNGRILGVFEAGAGVRVLERRGNWARVRREGWVLTSVLSTTAVTRPNASGAPSVTRTVPPRVGTPPSAPVRSSSAAPPRAPADSGGAGPGIESAVARPSGRSGALRTRADVSLQSAPGAEVVGSLTDGAVVEALARDRGWVRIRVEAWVPDSMLIPADTAFAESLSAADLRLDPVGLRGRLVRWTVQVVALQTADALRRSLSADEPYLLAMGPGKENAILYLAVPPSLLAQARTISPMANVIVTARVRHGRSEPTGAPVLDLLSITKQ